MRCLWFSWIIPGKFQDSISNWVVAASLHICSVHYSLFMLDSLRYWHNSYISYKYNLVKAIHCGTHHRQTLYIPLWKCGEIINPPLRMLKQKSDTFCTDGNVLNTFKSLLCESMFIQIILMYRNILCLLVLTLFCHKQPPILATTWNL
jgi:hypothetical protein